MGATGAISAASAGASGLSSISNAYAQSQALKAQGRFQSVVAESNAKMAELQAEDALRRGSRASRQAKLDAQRMIGSQRAALAASGIDPNSAGTASSIQEDTAAFGAMEALTIQNNAWREAYGYRVNAASASAQGRFIELTAGNQARNTLITGGLNAANAAMSGYANYRYARDYYRLRDREGGA